MSQFIDFTHKPIKIEDDSDVEIIDLECEDIPTPIDRLTRWHKNTSKKLSSCYMNIRENKLQEFLHGYLKSIPHSLSDDRGIRESMQTFVRDKLLVHLNDINILYEESKKFFIDVQDYFVYMENILTEYINLELELARYIRKKEMQLEHYMKITSDICLKICKILSTYLEHKEEHVLHIFMKMNFEKKNLTCRDVLRKLFTHYLVHVALENRSDETFCRNYIVLQIWKEIQNTNQHEVMDTIFFKKFRRKVEYLSRNEVLKAITRSKKTSFAKAAGKVMDPKSILSREYFEYMAEKKKRSEEIITLTSMDNLSVQDRDGGFLSRYDNNFSLFSTEAPKSFVDNFLFEEERDMFSELSLFNCTDPSEDLMKTDLDFEPSSSLYESRQMYIDLDYESDILCFDVDKDNERNNVLSNSELNCHTDLVARLSPESIIHLTDEEMSDENVESTNRLSEISEEAPQVAKEVDVQPPLKDHIKTAEFQLGLENWSLHHGIVTPPSDQRLEENSTYMDTGAKNHYLEIPGSESNFDENSSIVLGCSRNKECGEKESIESNVNYNSELSDCEGTEGIDTQETVPSPTANIENNNSEEIEVPVEFIKDKDWKKIKESSKVITESLCTSISPIELSASKNCYTSTKFSNSAIMYTPDQDEECDSPSYNSEVAENHVYFENGICNEEEIQTDECDNQSENSSEVMSVQQEPKCLDVSVEKDSNKNLLLKKSNENISNLPATPEQAHEVLNTSKTIHNKEIATKDVTSLNKNAEILINASNSDVVKRKLPDFFESPGKNIENVATPSKDLDEELQYTFSGPLKSATKQSSLIPTVKNNFITSSSSSSSLSSPAYEVIKAKEFQNELKRINNINIHELKQNCIVDRKARIASPMTRIETLQNYHESRKRRSDLWWQRENSNFVLDPTESLQIQAVRRTDKMLMMRVAVRLERLPLNKIPNHRQHHREQHHHTQVHNTTGSRIQIMYINDPNNTKEDYRTNTSEDYNYQHLNAPLKGALKHWNMSSSQNGNKFPENKVKKTVRWDRIPTKRKRSLDEEKPQKSKTRRKGRPPKNAINNLDKPSYVDRPFRYN